MLQRKRLFKIVLRSELSVLLLFYVGHVVRIEVGEVSLYLIGTNDFSRKGREEISSVVGRVVITTSNLKTSRRRLVDYVEKLQQRTCRTCSTITYDYPYNQSNQLIMALSLPLMSSTPNTIFTVLLTT